jgi:hypothetical protein
MVDEVNLVKLAIRPPECSPVIPPAEPSRSKNYKDLGEENYGFCLRYIYFRPVDIFHMP